VSYGDDDREGQYSILWHLFINICDIDPVINCLLCNRSIVGIIVHAVKHCYPGSSLPVTTYSADVRDYKSCWPYCNHDNVYCIARDKQLLAAYPLR